MSLRKLSLLFVLLVLLAPFQNCAPYKSKMNGELSTSSSGTGSGSADADMAAKFASTLQPVVRSNCAACHATIQAPMFAASDALAAYKTIKANALVDLNNPANSLLVQKILGGHNGFSMAIATDLQNAIQAWKDEVTPPADTTSPSVMISAPLAAASVSGQVTVSAIATDNVGVAGVQFYVDGVASGSEATAAPYSFLLNTASLTNGSHALSAKARDAAGNSATSAIVNVTVSNAVSDTVAPTVSISAPAAASTISGAAVTLSATAADNVGVVGVQFYLDGAPVGTEDLTAPYSIALDTTALLNGAHVISAKARDAAGNSTMANNVNVTVNNANANATFKFISANILVPMCVACHKSGGASGGYAFDTYTSTLKAVVAKSPSTSPLYTATKGGKMPPGGALSAAQLKDISDWITAGALNN
jgi:mono/diheme cytochrome c family protein